MAKRVRLAKIESLERRQAELAERMKTARRLTRERKKTEDARRATVLGAAIFAHAKPETLAEMITEIIPLRVKAKADLVLFKQWLSPEQIAAGTGDEHCPVDGAATETG